MPDLNGRAGGVSEFRFSLHNLRPLIQSSVFQGGKQKRASITRKGSGADSLLPAFQDTNS